MEKGERGGTILLVEDEPDVRHDIEVALECEGYSFECVDDGAETMRFLERPTSQVSVLLLDLFMAGVDGLSLLRQIRRRPSYQDLAVIVLSESSATTTIVEAVKAGADDFLTKPVTHAELASAIEKALSTRRRGKPVLNGPSRPNSSLPLQFPPGSWLGAMKSCLERIGASDEPVLIRGETGVGKEVVAQLLHSYSPRSLRPFLKLNCAALPSELVESELFGFEKGAFTGAFKSKPGKFDLADSGTLLLDEIGDMDFRIQAKLLQVLQDQQFERLGGKETINVDVRVIAATHCDLEKAIEAGRFREDLYHRLNVISLHVPPLRERLDEIIPLARYFLVKHSTSPEGPVEITGALDRALITYQWPGNVRELENFMRRYAVLRNPDQAVEELQRRSQRFEAKDKALKLPATAAVEGPLFSLSKVNEAQRNLEAEVILQALNAAHWNRKLAAARLGVDYKALLYKMKKLGLDGHEASVRTNAHPGRDYLMQGAAGND
jgi:two-component system response regulator AtoC